MEEEDTMKGSDIDGESRFGEGEEEEEEDEDEDDDEGIGEGDLSMILDAVEAAAEAGLRSVGGPPADSSISSLGCRNKAAAKETIVVAEVIPPTPVVEAVASEAVAIASFLPSRDVADAGVWTGATNCEEDEFR
ncbi:hypothetical protein HK097_005221 [Rhizophlyctis rosea]|uniref:Uncharacterized protein n=1 Tax=Rhizophlyctis rosea TaxID=64517 RepID=A0AAD5WWB8_9FUNG|nr:hypothetical protein HK097_005221 [Rhizophlyctis rosea]